MFKFAYVQIYIQIIWERMRPEGDNSQFHWSSL